VSGLAGHGGAGRAFAGVTDAETVSAIIVVSTMASAVAAAFLFIDVTCLHGLRDRTVKACASSVCWDVGGCVVNLKSWRDDNRAATRARPPSLSRMFFGMQQSSRPEP
jgi:hypothetical protein